MNELLIIEKQASSFRSDCGLNNDEPIRLKSLLQKLNVISIFSPLSDKFSGMAILAKVENSKSRFMMVNSLQSMGKQHFTICHELYHLFIQTDFSSQICITGIFDKKADKNEYYADVFASSLLLPKDGLLKFIPNEEISSKKISLQTILYIEQMYSCSRRALLYRLKTLKLISDEEYEKFTINVQKGAIENGYSTTLYKPGNNGVYIGDYGVFARRLFDSERISESHYFSLLQDLGVDVSLINE